MNESTTAFPKFRPLTWVCFNDPKTREKVIAQIAGARYKDNKWVYSVDVATAPNLSRTTLTEKDIISFLNSGQWKSPDSGPLLEDLIDGDDYSVNNPSQIMDRLTGSHTAFN